MRTEISLIWVNVFLLVIGNIGYIFRGFWICIQNHIGLQNESELFLAVVLGSCQVQVSLSDNDSRFLCLDCAYITSCLNVSCSGPARLDAAAQYLIWSFTELRRACTYTLTHTALCREHGPLFRYRFLLPRMQLCITANILKWTLFLNRHTPLSLSLHSHAFTVTHMHLSPVISSSQCNEWEFRDLRRFRSQGVCRR